MEQNRITRFMLTSAALAASAVVLLQGVVGISPNLYWDTDPRIDQSVLALTTFGPSGAMWLAVAQIGVAGLALIAHGRAGGRIGWGWVLLAGIGAGFAVWHMPGSMGDAFRCGQWLGASALGVAVAHLAMHTKPRRIMAAALAAMLVPWAVDAIHYVFLEHPRTLAIFRADEDQMLRARGWEAGSAEHRSFMRRMESGAALGSFALSNIFGTILAAISALVTALAVAAFRDRRWLSGLMIAGLAASGGMAVVLTHSKGAIGVLMVLVVVAIWQITWRAKKNDQTCQRAGERGMSLIALALPLSAVALVIVRGILGPPDSHTGEISLLYRFHYWEAAWRMIAADDWRTAVVGLGPSGFSQGYLIHKNPLNTEQVISAHNVFIDWITMLGVGGVAWSMLLIVWLWTAGRVDPRCVDGVERPIASSSQERTTLEIEPRAAACALALAIVIFGGQFMVQLPLLGHVSQMLIWLLGAAGFVVAMSVLMSSRALDGLGLRVGLSLAAFGVVWQSQIDMAFFHQGAGSICWMIVAVAAGRGVASRTDEEARAIDSGRINGKAVALSGLVMIGAVVMAITVAIPVGRHELHMKQAAMALRDGDLDRTLVELERASAYWPGELLSYRWQVSVNIEAAMGLSQAGRNVEAQASVHRALIELDEAFTNGVDTSAYWRLRARAQEHAAEILQEPGRLRSAASAWENVLSRSPYSISDHLALADLLWAIGDRDQAAALYRRCAELSDQAYLDPARQLGAMERRRVEARTAARQATP